MNTTKTTDQKAVEDQKVKEYLLAWEAKQNPNGVITQY